MRLRSGAGRLAELSLHACGGPLLLVTSAGFTRRGTTSRIRDLLGAERVAVYDGVTPNPDIDELNDATARWRSHAVASIVAVGGGSVIDTAKVLALTLAAAEERPLDVHFRLGRPLAWQQSLPVMAVPTTAGTGAEVTPFATVWDRRSRRKLSLADERMYPRVALLDPELTLTLPARETRHTALDAISHALESLWNKRRTPLSTVYAIQALRLAREALPAVVVDSLDLSARTGLQTASLLAGLAISETRTALAHSLSYPLTAHHGVPHGLACSFTLPALARRVLPELGERAIAEEIELTAGFLRELKLDAEIALQVSLDQALALASEMHTPERANNFIMEAIDVKEILREAFSGG